MEEKKKNILKNWRLWVGVGIIIVVVIVIIIMGLSKPKFEITNFSITSDTTEYTYIDNAITYDGKGLITTQNKKEKFLVILKKVLKSGGSENSEKETYDAVLINNGKGEFSTYDYGSEEKITKPEYEFSIDGYLKFN